VKFIVSKKEGKCNDLQQQEKNKIRISPDEEKYVTHWR
jgi:hypothetical protein